MLAYGAPADGQDDYMRMSESTAIQSIHILQGGGGCVWILVLRGSNEEETTQIMTENAAREFRVMLESIDCIH